MIRLIKMNTKQCTRCKCNSPVENFAKASGKKDGLQPWCKSCRRNYIIDNAVVIKRKRANFYVANRDRLREERKIAYEANAAKINDKSRLYYKTHKDRIKQKKKIWDENNRDSVRSLAKKTYWRNPEKKRQKNREHYQKNKSQYRSRDRFRRALEIGAAGSHTPEDIETLFMAQNGLCASPHCKCQLITEGKGKFHIDHDIPLVLGGSNGISNLSLLCPTCNKSKGAKTMTEFILSRLFADLAS